MRNITFTCQTRVVGRQPWIILKILIKAQRIVKI